MRYKECLKSRLEIRKVFKLNTTQLLVIHKYNHIHIYDITTCQLISTYYNEFLGSETTAITYDITSQTLAFANGNIIYLINLHTQKLIQTIVTINEEVMLLSFMPNSSYFIVGTRNGRVLLYTKEGKIPLARICSFPLPQKRELLYKNNYVSALDTYKDYLACSGYGGDIVIIKVNSLTSKHTIINTAIRIHTIRFINQDILLYGNAKGELTYYNIATQEKLEFTTPFLSIDYIELINDGTYALIGGKKEHTLMLFDITKQTIAKHQYIACHATIKNILLFDTKLFIHLAQEVLIVYDLDNTEKLQNYIQNQQLPLAYALVHENPLLSHTSMYKTLQKAYKQLYHKAIEGLLHNNHKEINKLLQEFETLSEQKEELLALQTAFRYYPKFQTLYREKKYPLALSMADKYPQLQKTPQYRKLEQIFKEDFSFAQKQLLLKNESLAKELLGAYLIVPSKKEICSLLLRNNTAFIQFLQALQHKDYKTLFQLAQRYEVFQTIPSFQLLQEEIAIQLKSIYSDIYSMKVDSIKKKIQELQYIPSISNQLKILFKTLLALENLLKAYEAEDFVACYETIDATPLLAHTQLTTLLARHWKKIIHQCEIYALRGEIKKVKTTLGELINITTRTESIGNLLRLSFQTKIKQLLVKKLFKKAELLIYSYIDIFGLDTQLQQNIKEYEKYTKKNLAITLSGGFKLSRDSWRHSKIMEH